MEITILVIGQPNSGKKTFAAYLKEQLPDALIFATNFAHEADFIIEIINRGQKLFHHDKDDVDVEVDNSRDLDNLRHKAIKVAEAIKNGHIKRFE